MCFDDAMGVGNGDQVVQNCCVRVLEMLPSDRKVSLRRAHVPASIERQEQASNRVLALHVSAVQGHKTSTRPQYLGSGCEQGAGHCIGEVMQDAERDNHVECAKAVHGLQRNGANNKRSTMTIAFSGCGDVVGLDVVAMII